MADLDREQVSDQDGFEYGYRVFIEVVGALALEPSAQARQNGNYNTAFELIHDARSGRYLVESPASCLSERSETAGQ